MEGKNRACAGVLIGDDDLEFVDIFGRLEQIELNRGFVLAADLFADKDKAVGRGPRLGFLVGLEKAELTVQLTPTFAALNHPFELSETFEGNRNVEFDARSMKPLSDGLVEKRAVDTRLCFDLRPRRMHAVQTVADEGLCPIRVVDTTGAVGFDVFRKISLAEWDSLLFFYGVVLCVGALGSIGYLALTSEVMYTQMGATFANVMVGFLSAIVDNIPVMFAVLTMEPEMSQGQWLLVTLTAGVGGSMLSIGSAAGVALMGQARGKYTFFSHLKWAPVIALGYAASIMVHFWINASHF